ncbi:MAG TPA: exodeoxyribonuclease VII small subunit [Candidatus Nanoperiomorbaceae bacterium]|jgi:exodeoxyribonuclease VII small subunit|nr:exodeoxyribonuclease VII small subunit [Candidatus Nanoperiomorbaceae bacterium]HMQ97079.1 exodeoxyribonuclease VII small subunit [Candidatus Nanoperiomorbaceae bacterium]HMR86220.1 exodeoxyribonuclease VII small subunit [Candidatus Nanoperiomorbaceae bacterium]HMU12216.1 exodeoxyribonuclease VII small subunit [Candidatus Nanoperiomorbaceae bacterium]
MPEQSKNLRQLLDEFETIVEWFNQDDLDIDQAISKFEEGSKLAETIKQQLATAKNKIEIVKADFAAKASQSKE